MQSPNATTLQYPPPLPQSATWLVPPVTATVDDDGRLTIGAGPRTDLFHDPKGGSFRVDAPTLLWEPPPGDFIFSAQVSVAFDGPYDAGALVIYHDQSHWAKLCFEFSAQGTAMVVSVVTREYSDDSDAAAMESDSIHLRIARLGAAYVFHYSQDAYTWTFVRVFHLAESHSRRIGFCAQAPQGPGCTSAFSQISIESRSLEDLRGGA